MPPAGQIENLQEQLRDKDKQLGNLKDRVKSLQTDSSNTDTALATLEEALSEKVRRQLSQSPVVDGRNSLSRILHLLKEKPWDQLLASLLLLLLAI